MSILTVTEKSVIPSYPLSQNSSTMIEVREARGEASKLAEDFLIPHRKDYYLFVFVKKGNSRHWIDFIPYTLKPNTFYFTVPQQVHLKEDSGPMQGFFACFTEAFLELEENSMLRQLPIIQNPKDGHELILSAQDVLFIEDLMKKMLNEFNASNSWRNQMLISWLKILVIYLSRLYTEQFNEVSTSQHQPLVKSFQKLIGQHYHHLHDVASYARMVNLSPGYLNDLVKQQSGKTAITHIHNRLIVEARRRLLHTELSVKQIADELGFEDAAYFNRFFKRNTNITPVAYRQQIREMYH